ncbi:MAG: hypothetical protein A3G24_29015 [Betaproteobacteria bacterium RIFCSPLOWO2_12_FULL_62_13]|nr:MAG: hypothetical protein A3G24_29015 [Betaproteobacteria bacterium RIFCSPLOWO2_12_FULL_62_13]
MSAAVFDTHAVVKRLKAAGFTEQQAEAHAETLAEAITGQLATKTDLIETGLRIETRMTKLEGDITTRTTKLEGDMTLLKWMLGFNLAFTVGILVKLLAS